MVKTTIDIHDELLARARVHARRTGRPLSALVEKGLRQVLSDVAPRHRYRLPDHSVGRAEESDPLDGYSWQDLREITYGAP